MDNFIFEKKPSNVFGLKWIPDIPGRNDLDGFSENCNIKNVPVEFSSRDQEILLKKFNTIKDNCKCIVEIGVCRNKFELTSTHIFLNIKNDNTFYFGIDIEDKSYLNNPVKNIYTFKISSFERETIIKKINDFGIKEIDFLFIDGWHSINAVINDWQFIEFLNPKGIIGFHDTSIHPGPYLVFNAIDESLFIKEKFFEDYNDDWGISFVSKI